MSIRKGNTLIAGNATFGYRPPLLQSFWSDHILNRPDLLRADTFSWQSGKMYKAVYKELVSEYDNENSVEETEGGITFKRTPKGYKIADSSQEMAILEKYNTYGIAWYYILSKDNTQFKLPRTKFGFEGVRDSVGNDIAESLPQHTHTISIGKRAKYQINGGASAESQYGVESYTNYTSTGADNSTYQDNAPVQERATQMYLYFYVGNYTQSAIEQTAGINTELFNNKADKTEVDGQIVYLNQTLSTATATGTFTIDLSSYIPNDDFDYELMIFYRFGYTDSSRTYISTDLFPFGGVYTTTSASSWVMGVLYIPLRKRELLIVREVHSVSNAEVKLVAYRRLGRG